MLFALPRHGQSLNEGVVGVTEVVDEDGVTYRGQIVSYSSGHPTRKRRSLLMEKYGNRDIYKGDHKARRFLAVPYAVQPFDHAYGAKNMEERLAARFAPAKEITTSKEASDSFAFMGEKTM